MTASVGADLDVDRIRADFPILSRVMRGGNQLAYLDSGATSQKPLQVLDAERDFLTTSNGAVHRGAHQLMEESTDAYEQGRADIAGVRRCRPRRAGVHQERHRGAQPGVLCAGRQPVRACRRTRRRHRHHRTGTPRQPDPVAGAGPPHRRDAALVRRHRRRPHRPGLAASSTSASKSLPSPIIRTSPARCAPVAELVARARAVGALTVLDACQSVPHQPVDFHALDVDFAAFSGHKMLGPTGIGVLYGRARAARRAAAVPHRRIDDRDRHDGGDHLRARAAAVRGGHPDDLAGGRTGRGRTLSRRDRHGRGRRPTNTELVAAALDGSGRRSPACGSSARPTPADRGSPVAFVVDGVHAHDVGQVLDDDGRRGAGRSPLRVAAAPPLRRRRHRASIVRGVQHPRRGGPAGRRACAGPSSSSAGTERRATGADVPGSDPGPLQAPAPPRAARAVRRRGAPRQPDLR